MHPWTGASSGYDSKTGLPTVPVDDIKIHPRENDLVIGTHGRGIWIMDDIAPLERLTPEVVASTAHLFPGAACHLVQRLSSAGLDPRHLCRRQPADGRAHTVLPRLRHG